VIVFVARVRQERVHHEGTKDTKFRKILLFTFVLFVSFVVNHETFEGESF